MTDKEKAKAYDGAIERSKKIYGNSIAEEIFPELKESEDDRIKKAIIEFFESEDDNTTYSLVRKKDIIAWLEKQGEQKPTLPKWKYKKDNTPLLRDSIILNKYGGVAKSPSGAIVSDAWVLDYDELAKLPKEENIEPKFKVGDWIITPTNKVLQITSIEGTSYRFNNKSHYWAICYCDEECRLWTIQDAKDGDILSYQCGYLKNRTIYIYRYNKIMNTAYYVALSGDNDSTFKIDNKGVCSLNGYGSTARFATEEEKQKLFDAIKENGYKWNAETKTLEKLIQPKFKVGDMVRHKKANKDDVYEISKVYDDSYGIAGFSWMIYMKYQDQYELIPNKFDPNTLKPFDRVLVRDSGENWWRCAIYSHRNENNKYYIASDTIYKYCIPYNDDTKHLVGTSDEAPEFYRYWEE